MTLRSRDAHDATAPICTVRITFKGRSATLEEIDVCLYYTAWSEMPLV